MTFLLFLVGIVIGSIIVPLIKKVVDHIILKKREVYNTYDIKFKLTFTTKPSLFDDTQKAKVFKTNEISIKLEAKDNDDALETLNEILHQEVGYELVTIEQINQ